MIHPMAQTSSPAAKKPPTIQSSGSPKPAPVSSAPEPSPTQSGAQGWLGGLPPPSIALKIVTGFVDPPPELRDATQSFLSSLTFAETAALHQSQPTGDIASLCSIVASRWRLMSALALRPQGEVAPDAAALEQLLQEVDGTLASLGKLKNSDDPDIREACDAARAALAKDVHKLLPMPTGAAPAAGEPSASDDLKQLRSALAAAAKSEKQAGKGLHSVTQSKKTMAILAVGLISMATGTYSVVKAVRHDQAPPVPALPEPPPNTEVVGNPESGTVIVRSTNGKPIEHEALQQFKIRAANSGANVQMIGPTQALVTSAKSH